jgi:hypothetical protein
MELVVGNSFAMGGVPGACMPTNESPMPANGASVIVGES